MGIGSYGSPAMPIIIYPGYAVCLPIVDWDEARLVPLLGQDLVVSHGRAAAVEPLDVERAADLCSVDRTDLERVRALLRAASAGRARGRDPLQPWCPSAQEQRLTTRTRRTRRPLPTVRVREGLATDAA